MYLDHAAATPIDPAVYAAMQPFFCDKFFNPSSPYAPAVAVRREYTDAKDKLARLIGARSSELIMTAGATESINIAVTAAGAGRIITAHTEHQAVLAATRARLHTFVSTDRHGLLSSDHLKKAITDETTLISVGLANSELGTIQPMMDITTMVKTIRQDRASRGVSTPIYVHCDASQGAGQLDIHVAKLGIDMMTLNAGKIYGPKQVGLLWAENHVPLTSLVRGGGQERGIRSGTENVAGVIGFARALELVEKKRKSETKRLSELRDYLQNNLQEQFQTMIVSGHPKKRLSSHLHVSFPRIDAERLVFLLEARNVYVATGSACAANKGSRSHILSAIGLSDSEADGSLRISLGALNSTESIKRAAYHIVAAVHSEITRVTV